MVVVADMQLGGVQEDVGELLVVEPAGPKGPPPPRRDHYRCG